MQRTGAVLSMRRFIAGFCVENKRRKRKNFLNCNGDDDLDDNLEETP